MVRQTNDSDKDRRGKVIGPGYFNLHWANHTSGAVRKRCNSYRTLLWKPMVYSSAALELGGRQMPRAAGEAARARGH